MNLAEVAGQLGHNLQTLFATYAHVIEELRGRDKIDSEAEIRTARSGSVKGRSSATARTGAGRP
jgi:hypothetical protein